MLFFLAVKWPLGSMGYKLYADLPQGERYIKLR